MEYENKEICKECGGKCCKKSGCDYFVSDFEHISYEELNKVLQTGNVSIIATLKFSKLNNGKKVATPFLYLRARNTDRDIVDLFSMKRQCSMLEENGCKYTLEQRPGGGVNLIPQKLGNCTHERSPIEEIKKWEPYQKVLFRLVKRYCGMSVDEKIKQDVEQTIYDILMENFEGIAKEEIIDVLSCINDVASCYPEAFKKAKERQKKNTICLLKKNK